MIRPPHRPIRRANAGLTFVEVIVSLGVLAGAATLVFGTMAYLENVAAYNRDRLNGMEVAHRVVLMCIDDFKSLRGQAHKTAMGGRMYQFDVEEDVLLDESGVEARGHRSSVSQRRKSVKTENIAFEDRLAAAIHQLTVVVYVQLPDGSRSPHPVATLVRSYNPLMGLGTRGLKYFNDVLQQSTGQRGIE